MELLLLQLKLLVLRLELFGLKVRLCVSRTALLPLRIKLSALREGFLALSERFASIKFKLMFYRSSIETVLVRPFICPTVNLDVMYRLSFSLINLI